MPTEREQRFIERRRARFEAAGVQAEDVAYAATGYLGVNEAQCCLCDTPIKYNFLLRFDRPSGAVAFEPVGSDCITSWMLSMPQSEARDRLVERVRELERDLRRQRDCLRAMEREHDADGLRLVRAFIGLPEAVRHPAAGTPLADIGNRTIRFGGFRSASQRSYFAVLLRQAGALGALGSEPATPSAPAALPSRSPDLEDRLDAAMGGAGWDAPGAALAQPDARDAQPESEDTALLRRWRALPEAIRQHPERIMDTDRAAAFEDMGGRLARFGTFLTDRQRRYFTTLLGDAARAAGGPLPTPGPAATAAAGVDAETRDLLGRFATLPEGVRNQRDTLGDIGRRAASAGEFGSFRQRSYFRRLLCEAEARAANDPATVAGATVNAILGIDPAAPPPAPPAGWPTPAPGSVAERAEAVTARGRPQAAPAPAPAPVASAEDEDPPAPAAVALPAHLTPNGRPGTCVCGVFVTAFGGALVRVQGEKRAQVRCVRCASTAAPTPVAQPAAEGGADAF